MNKLIIASLLAVSVNSMAMTHDFADVGPASLFYDMTTTDNDFNGSDIVATPDLTAGIDFSDVGPEILFYDFGEMASYGKDDTPIAIINRNKGKREYLHEDVVPVALLY